MGLDIHVLIVDWTWLGESPQRERLSRLREAWYDDATGLWGHDAPETEGEWQRPRGPAAHRFACYEFRRTCGSYKAHFWAGQRWESIRHQVGPQMRTGLDALLLGLILDGPDGDVRYRDQGFFGDDAGVSRGLLVARSPSGVRELAAVWQWVRPLLSGLRAAFEEHAAVPDGWVGDFDAFARLLEDWGRVLAEAARWDWGVVGLSE
ncbi:hypothetical protein [Streptomyces sp. bgisy100]|uniref:hypothetical protein n=1 Tax=Streptomyces sp. bgisy100 TaxID=3413783 RepID=UPI003D70B53D